MAIMVRALDTNGDWTFGQGTSDYLQANQAIAQNIKTRLSSFLNNCYFDLTAGIDWWNLLGSTNVAQLNISVNTTIFNTEGVTNITQLLTEYNPTTRAYTVQYSAQTIYSTITGVFVYNPTSNIAGA